ncbi:MAG: hypothetical protein J5752_00090 [Clostridiales bacterium]|nr:hypothetical protein [Clostridiales bacterium]
MKGKSKVFLISFFFVWVAVILLCLFHLYKAKKYELGYGNFPTITVTDDQVRILFLSGSGRVDFIQEQGVMPDVEEQRTPFSTHLYKVVDGFLYYSRGHASSVDLEATHITNIQNEVKTELTQDEICAFLLLYKRIVPPNTQIEYNKGRYTLSGEYEGEIVSEMPAQIPLESTDYQEVRDKVVKEERPVLIIHMLICLGIFGLFTLPLVALAKGENYLGLIICGILFIIAIFVCCYQYCDISHSAIGVNWHDSFGI